MCTVTGERWVWGHDLLWRNLPTAVLGLLLHRFGSLQCLYIRPWNPHEYILFYLGSMKISFFWIFFKFQKMSWISEVMTSCACPQFSIFAKPVAFELAVRGAPEDGTKMAGWFSCFWAFVYLSFYMKLALTPGHSFFFLLWGSCVWSGQAQSRRCFACCLLVCREPTVVLSLLASVESKHVISEELCLVPVWFWHFKRKIRARLRV